MSYATEHELVFTEHIHLLEIVQIMYNMCEKLVFSVFTSRILATHL
jgi:hypothetical protein